MRRLIALLFLIIATPAFAADPPAAPAVKGLWLLTDYPSQTVRPGEVANIRFKLQNAGLAPEPLALTVDGAPAMRSTHTPPLTPTLSPEYGGEGVRIAQTFSRA